MSGDFLKTQIIHLATTVPDYSTWASLICCHTKPDPLRTIDVEQTVEVEFISGETEVDRANFPERKLDMLPHKAWSTSKSWCRTFHYITGILRCRTRRLDCVSVVNRNMGGRCSMRRMNCVSGVSSHRGARCSTWFDSSHFFVGRSMSLQSLLCLSVSSSISSSTPNDSRSFSLSYIHDITL